MLHTNLILKLQQQLREDDGLFLSSRKVNFPGVCSGFFFSINEYCKHFYICKGLRPWVDTNFRFYFWNWFTQVSNFISGTGLHKFQILFLELVYASFKFYFWNWSGLCKFQILFLELVYTSFKFYFWNWFTQVSNFISGTDLYWFRQVSVVQFILCKTRALPTGVGRSTFSYLILNCKQLCCMLGVGGGVPFCNVFPLLIMNRYVGFHFNAYHSLY